VTDKATSITESTEKGSIIIIVILTPLDLYLTSRVIAYRKRARDSGMDRLIEKACTRIKSTLGKPQVCTATAALGRPVQEGRAEEWIGPRRDREAPGQDKRDIGRAGPQRKSARPTPRAA
jgi:hypothetical protein